MAITLVKQPDNWGRAFDTNRLIYKFSSNHYTEPNFQFQFNCRYYNVDGTYQDLGTYNIFPKSDGTVEFNPATIYRNFLDPEINLSDTNLEECITMSRKFQLFVWEFYGSPPVRKTLGNWYESTPRIYYNGCQQVIPYDYIPLNPSGNTIWV